MYNKIISGDGKERRMHIWPILNEWSGTIAEKTDLEFPISWHATEKDDKEMKKKSIVNEEEIFNMDGL